MEGIFQDTNEGTPVSDLVVKFQGTDEDTPVPATVAIFQGTVEVIPVHVWKEFSMTLTKSFQFLTW